MTTRMSISYINKMKLNHKHNTIISSNIVRVHRMKVSLGQKKDEFH